MSSKLWVSSFDTKEISNWDFKKISLIEKDIWATWIWEYVKCNCCDEIYSKEDIFWHLSTDIRKKSVDKLEEIFLWDTINCKKCNSWNTSFIYDIDLNIEYIKDRYKNSVTSCLSILHDDEWNFYWFSDWYVDKFKFIYQRELLTYFWNDLYNDLLNDWLVDKYINYFCCSSVWILEERKNFKYLYYLLKTMYFSIDDKYNDLIWTAEIDNESFIRRLSINLWAKKYLLDSYNRKNKNNNNYSNLYFQDWLIWKYKELFSYDLREFISKNFKSTCK